MAVFGNKQFAKSFVTLWDHFEKEKSTSDSILIELHLCLGGLGNASYQDWEETIQITLLVADRSAVSFKQN